MKSKQSIICNRQEIRVNSEEKSELCHLKPCEQKEHELWEQKYPTQSPFLLAHVFLSPFPTFLVVDVEHVTRDGPKSLFSPSFPEILQKEHVADPDGLMLTFNTHLVLDKAIRKGG